jgi:hypothetical protein
MISNLILDSALLELHSADRLYVCSQAPTSFTEATDTYALGQAIITITATPIDGVLGRRLVIPAISGGTELHAGVATHFALINSITSTVLKTGSLNTSFSISGTALFNVSSFEIAGYETISEGGNPVVEEESIIINIGTLGETYTFAPVIQLNGSATVIWRFANNTNSSSLTPSYQYLDSQEVLLQVSPWSALEMLNLGYGGEDGGSVSIPNVANQHVNSITNLELATALKTMCVSYSPITNGTIFSTVPLVTFEGFNAGLTSFTPPTTIKRLCLEDCSTPTLDVSACLDLEDLRGAVNGMTSLNFGSTTFLHLWHICVRQNLFTSLRSTNFPALTEYWGWNNPGLTGTLVIDSDVIDSIYVNDCNYTALDFSGINSTRTVIKVGAGGNELTSVILGSNSFEEIEINLNPNLEIIDLTGQTHIQRFNGNGCAFNATTIEHIAHILDESGITSISDGVYDGVSLDLSSGTNASANANALAHLESLITKGWTVAYNESEVPVDFTENMEDGTPTPDASIINPAGLITLPNTNWSYEGLSSMQVNLNGIVAPHYYTKPLASGTFACGFAYKAATLPTGASYYPRICGIGNSGNEDVRITDQYNNDDGNRRLVAWIYGEYFLITDIINAQELRLAISYTANGIAEVRAYNMVGNLLGTASKITENGTPTYIRFGALDPVESINTSIYFDQFKLDYGTDMHPILV